MKKDNNYQDIYETCKRHMHSYVLVETTDGLTIDGIITGLDDENLYLAVPITEQGHSNPSPNQFGGYPYYGGGPGFGFRPQRRFRRLVLPLAFLAALSLLPWY